MLATGIMYYILNIEGITIVENELDPELWMFESLSIEKPPYHWRFIHLFYLVGFLDVVLMQN